MKHRTQEEIVALILEVIANSNSGATQTIITIRYLSSTVKTIFVISVGKRPNRLSERRSALHN